MKHEVGRTFRHLVHVFHISPFPGMMRDDATLAGGGATRAEPNAGGGTTRAEPRDSDANAGGSTALEEHRDSHASLPPALTMDPSPTAVELKRTASLS